MISAAHADAAVALIDAANGEGDWPGALKLVGRAFNGQGAILMGYTGFAEHPAEVLATSVRPEHAEHYLRDYAALDFRMPFIARQPSGKILHDYLMGPIDEIDNTPFYAEFLRPLDIGRFVGVNLGANSAEPKSLTYFAVAKANDFGPPTEAECQAILSMAKLARGAVRTAGVVAALKARADHLREAIEQLDIGVVFLTSAGVVVDCNAAARRLFAARQAVTVEHRRLRFFDDDADTRLKRLLRSDISLLPGEMWTARDGAEGGALVVVAATLTDAELKYGGQVVTLFLIDPKRRGPGGRKAWRRVFKLTHSECEVADLMLQGLSRREIAEARNVSEGTVHTQMRTLYAKLHVSKLNDALLLLSATAGR